MSRPDTGPDITKKAIIAGFFYFKLFLQRRITMCKKLFYLITFVLVLVAAPEVTHAQVENLMLNPSFEEDEDISAEP